MSIEQEIIRLLKSTKRQGMKDLIDYLSSSDFFDAPASTRYHGAYAGGLAEHSLNVYNCLTFHYNNLQGDDFLIPEIPEDSLIITALLHDVCKVNSYHEDFRNVKNAQGVWEKVPTYKKDALLPMGHGGKSIFILQQFIQLTVPEALAIFWHMGAYDTSDYMTRNELGKAYSENLLAFLLHQADMTATYIAENDAYIKPE